MSVEISVVIPAYNAEATVGQAVRSVVGQPVDRGVFECILVDDGSSDGTAAQAESAGAVVIRLDRNRGISGARNAGVAAARGRWVAFTDSDCVVSRRWLATMLAASRAAEPGTLGLAGKTVGLDSHTPAARFMDLIGALDAETYLRDEVFPWAPGCNLAYRREHLETVGGFDERLCTYETPDIHLRLSERFGGRIRYLPRAVVMHRHRETWGALWRQQRNYGVGRARFMLRHRSRWPWSVGREAAAWGRLSVMAARACLATGDQALVRRGLLVKTLAQRIGFARTFFSPKQRRGMMDAEASA